ncbi:hypothetical protein ADL00_30030 [Streptomyces sp. AS58]|nr:hypothetical protein ADL00_30030 [Streptomyces sp. AS58]
MAEWSLRGVFGQVRRGHVAGTAGGLRAWAGFAERFAWAQVRQGAHDGHDQRANPVGAITASGRMRHR